MRNEMIQALSKIQGMEAMRSIAALHQLGKATRETVPIDALGKRPVLTRNAVAFIAAIEANLIPALLPQRHAKMSASPAAFFRGTAELMAYDLSHEVQTGVRVLGDGDAHLQNFGFYASPERNLLFDLNDFDEAAPNSFEFDVKRLTTSVYLLGAEAGFAQKDLDDLAVKTVRAYRKAVKRAFKRPALKRFYASTAVADLAKALPDKPDRAFLAKIVTKARGRNHESVVKKYTEKVGTRLRFVDDAPRSVHVGADTEVALMAGFADYMKSTRADVALLLSQYHITDLIRHSVGIGSFGTYCYLVLLTGLGGSHLVLQIKEALPRRRELAPNTLTVTQALEVSEGQRIIAAQQILQQASDPFLGWFNGMGKSFYVRQFRDMKESVDVASLNWDQFAAYCRICGHLLGVAHAQSPTAAVAAGYMNKTFDATIQQWAKGYVGQVNEDYAAFRQRYPAPVADS